MTRPSQQATGGSLSATVIRACEVHQDCPLDCPERLVEELGEIASFTQPGLSTGSRRPDKPGKPGISEQSKRDRQIQVQAAQQQSAQQP